MNKEPVIEQIIRYSKEIIRLKEVKQMFEKIALILTFSKIKLYSTNRGISNSIIEIETRIFEVRLQIRQLLLPLLDNLHEEYEEYKDINTSNWELSSFEINRGYVELTALNGDTHILFLKEYKDSKHHYKQGDIVQLHLCAPQLGNLKLKTIRT
jgi:hypothetical protein